MEKRRKVDTKWYEKLPQRNWNSSVISNISRPSSRKSKKVGALQEPDWVSLGSSTRSLSRSSTIINSPNASFTLRKRRQSKGSLEDILHKHQVPRPRSVSLVKYGPLPAINSDLSRGHTSTSETSSWESIEGNFDTDEIKHSESLPRLSGSGHICPIEEHETEHLDNGYDKGRAPRENDVSSSSEDEDKDNKNQEAPPKLIRSNTFEVLETSLTNLPVIEDSSQGSDVKNSDTSDETLEVKVNVDGLSLRTFLNQSDDDCSSRPLSLTTHPGSPRRNILGSSESLSHEALGDSSSFELTSNFERRLSDSEVTNYNNNIPLDLKELNSTISIKLPDSSSVDMKFDLDVTLQDFLTSLQSLEWEEKRFHIADDIDITLLTEPLSKLHFNSGTQVYLVPNS